MAEVNSAANRVELVESASKEQWEKVEVRRALEAVPSSECGPSRAVRLGLGQRTLEASVARWIRPCYAQSSPLRQAPVG